MIEGDVIRLMLLLELVKMELEREGQVQSMSRRKKSMVKSIPRRRWRRRVQDSKICHVGIKR